MKIFTVITSILLLTLYSCSKDNEENPSEPKAEPFAIALIDGKSQKGPFLNSSSLTLFELDNSFVQTGNVFSTQILDNFGSFQFNNINTQTSYAKLKADGFYFNEISNSNSSAPISLYALSDLTNKSTVNINLLSTLEVSRMEYLLSNGATFNVAKQQAQAEILNIFSINKIGIAESELLDISINNDDNAILLAISLIIQGYRTEAELIQLLGDISTDIRVDGILNNKITGSALINDAHFFSLPTIRTNIENKYASLGATTIIPNFEKYINQFIESTNFTFTNNIIYPEFSSYGENVLYGNKTSFSSGLSLAANLPIGADLKIVITGGLWYYQVLPNGPINWTISTYDFVTEQQTFTSTNTGKNCDLIFSFDPGTHLIEYYENNSPTPTRTKTIVY